MEDGDQTPLLSISLYIRIKPHSSEFPCTSTTAMALACVILQFIVSQGCDFIYFHVPMLKPFLKPLQKRISLQLNINFSKKCKINTKQNRTV